MKKLLALILLGSMTLCGCSANGTSTTTASTTSTKTKENIFKANYDAIYEELFDDERNETSDLIMNTIFDNLEYTTLKSEVDGDVAYITTEITALDVISASIKATEEYTMLCLDDALSGDNKSEGEELKILKKHLKRAEEITTIITLEMEKEDGEWNLVVNDDLIYAITGSNGVFDLFAKYVEEGYHVYGNSDFELYLVEREGDEVKFYIENNTNDNLVVALDSIYVNYLMADFDKKVSLSANECLTFKIKLPTTKTDLKNLNFNILAGDSVSNLDLVRTAVSINF